MDVKETNNVLINLFLAPIKFMSSYPFRRISDAGPYFGSVAVMKIAWHLARSYGACQLARAGWHAMTIAAKLTQKGPRRQKLIMHVETFRLKTITVAHPHKRTSPLTQLTLTTYQQSALAKKTVDQVRTRWRCSRRATWPWTLASRIPSA